MGRSVGPDLGRENDCSFYVAAPSLLGVHRFHLEKDDRCSDMQKCPVAQTQGRSVGEFHVFIRELKHKVARPPNAIARLAKQGVNTNSGHGAAGWPNRTTLDPILPDRLRRNVDPDRKSTRLNS